MISYVERIIICDLYCLVSFFSLFVNANDFVLKDPQHSQQLRSYTNFLVKHIIMLK